MAGRAYRPYSPGTFRVGEYRSGLEAKNGDRLKHAGVAFQYEKIKLAYTQPEMEKTYLTDFVLPNGIIVETKGRFLTSDRQQAKYLRASHPDLDLRFVFSNAKSRLNKESDTTYAMWCERYGFEYASALIPQSWIDEPHSEARWELIRRATFVPKKDRKKT